jgi:hypothetical protein
MIEIPIKKSWIITAEKKAEELGRLNNSIREGKGNKIGILGEILVADYYHNVRKFPTKIVNNFDYDLDIDGIRVDVKTKETTVIPEDYFYCSVASYNTSQKCDLYYFVRIMTDLSRGWLLGGLLREDFYEKSTFGKKGEIDPTSRHNWRFRADCYNVPIKELIAQQ